MGKANVVVISADSTLVEAATQAAIAGRMSLVVVRRLSGACRRLHESQPTLVVLDDNGMTDPSEVAALLGRIASIDPPSRVIVLGARIPSELLSPSPGAARVTFLARPFDPGEVKRIIESMSNPPREERPLAGTRGCLEDRLQVGPSRWLIEQARRIAESKSTILIQGEPGTGKSCFARLIHDSSSRRYRRFITVHCGRGDADDLDVTLFGQARRSASGRVGGRLGALGRSGRGTLLLKAVDGLPYETQARLLPAVEERVYEPAGRDRLLPLRSRLIATSSSDLEHEVASGRIRAELLHRLNVIPVRLPPLRERRDEIPGLVEHVLTALSAIHARQVSTVSDAALSALVEYDWPGNLRELTLATEYAIARCSGHTLQPDDLPPCIVRPGRAETNGPVEQVFSSVCGRSGASRSRLRHLFERLPSDSPIDLGVYVFRYELYSNLLNFARKYT